ncbi:MAG TPA: hypothetical protein VF384_13735, partial [Planctomycetota bacterium]
MNSHTADTPHRPWASARRFLRGVIAARTSTAVANALLPVDAAEAHAPPLSPRPLPDTFAALAITYPTLLATDQRKQRGAWFTPLSLAEPTVARTLAPLLRDKDPTRLRICDPAVGG